MTEALISFLKLNFLRRFLANVKGLPSLNVRKLSE